MRIDARKSEARPARRTAPARLTAEQIAEQRLHDARVMVSKAVRACEDNAGHPDLSDPAAWYRWLIDLKEILG